MASFWGRLFGIASQLIVQQFYTRSGEEGRGDVNAMLYLAGSVTLGCVVRTALLPGNALEIVIKVADDRFHGAPMHFWY